MKHRIKWILPLTAGLLPVLFAVLLFAFSIGRETDISYLDKVLEVEQMTASVADGPKEPVTLPHSFSGLAPRTKVILEAKVPNGPSKGVLIKTVYAPAKIYADGVLIYEYGRKEHYPDYMLDPATELHWTDLPGDGGEVTLRMEFLSPRCRNTLTVHPPLIGTVKEVTFDRFQALGGSDIFALVQLIGGFALILVSVCIVLIDKKGVAFLWLGLFAFTTGMWALGENNFTGLVVKNATFLYLMAFIGMFTFIIPLLHFTRTIVDFEHPMPLFCMEIFFTCAAALALILQFAGVLPFASSMYFFHITLPIALIVMTVFTVIEAVRYRNMHARRYILPMAILALSGILELCNYQLRMTFLFSSIFQVGILFFLLVMGVLAGFSVKDSIDLKNREKELSFERSLLDMQTEEQKERSLLLVQNEQELRQRAHDLRHHLTVIAQLSEGNDKLQDYLSAMMDRLPKAKKRFCENEVVNALFSHYSSLCERKNIRLEANLLLPPSNDSAFDRDLCVIFANLLENAAEACDRMTEGEKFIRINSMIRYEMLTITMDNSFDGHVQKEGERFRSAKRDDFGIGIASIQSVAQKANGSAEFTAEGHVFRSSVCIRI